MSSSGCSGQVRFQKLYLHKCRISFPTYTGGYILFTMRDGYGATDPDFALFDVRVQVYTNQGNISFPFKNV